MSRTTMYHTTVEWKGEHWGHLVMGNGPEMDFSAPPDAQGHAGVLTPEDAFVAAVNTCVMMMFIWTAERFKLNLLSYACRAEGTKLVELDRTEMFTWVRLWPVIQLEAGDEEPSAVEGRTRRALQAARKYSLVANSVKSEIVIEPTIEVVHQSETQLTGDEIMLSVKVLGPGCANCERVEEVARQAVASLGLDASIEHITNKADMAAYRLLATPGLVINEKLVCAGRIPTVQEVNGWLQAAMATA